jgi:hypothetical protein
VDAQAGTAAGASNLDARPSFQPTPGRHGAKGLTKDLVLYRSSGSLPIEAEYCFQAILEHALDFGASNVRPVEHVAGRQHLDCLGGGDVSGQQRNPHPAADLQRDVRAAAGTVDNFQVGLRRDLLDVGAANRYVAECVAVGVGAP